MSLTQSGIDETLGAVRNAGTGAEGVAASDAAQGPASEAELRRILGLTVPVTVTLAEREMSIESILEFTLGTIIEFNVLFDAELTLSVANHPVAYGQTVKIGEHFGLRVTSVDAVRDRIDALGA